MRCRDKTGAAIVDAYEVVRGAFRIGHVAAIEQHNGNLRTLQRPCDAAVHSILFPGQFDGREKDSGHLLRNEGMDHLFSLFSGLTHGCGAVAPQQRVGPREGVRIMP